MDECPITYQEIEAYCRLTETVMRPWEAKAVVTLFWAHKQGRPQKSEGAKEIADSSDATGVKAITGNLGTKRSVVRKKG